MRGTWHSQCTAWKVHTKGPGSLPHKAIMLSTASIVSSSFAGPVIGRAGSSITMQEAPTVTLNGLPGTPGGPEFAKTLPGVLAPFGYLCASLILTGRLRPAFCA